MDRVWLSLTDADDGTPIWVRADQVLSFYVVPAAKERPALPGQNKASTARKLATVVVTSDRLYRVDATPAALFDGLKKILESTE